MVRWPRPNQARRFFGNSFDVCLFSVSGTNRCEEVVELTYRPCGQKYPSENPTPRELAAIGRC
jgi:hypothetical protein